MATTDLTLILRAQQGERDALDELLRQHQERLYRYIAGVVGIPAAEDVLQETFLRIARKLRWLSEPAYFRAWSFRIASREAFRALRALRPNVPLEDLDATRLPVDAPSLSRVELDELRETVAALSPGSRAVIQLHYFEELSLDEVALALDIPLGTVKSRLAYGLEQLRRTYRKNQ